MLACVVQCGGHSPETQWALVVESTTWPLHPDECIVRQHSHQAPTDAGTALVLVPPHGHGQHCGSLGRFRSDALLQDRHHNVNAKPQPWATHLETHKGCQVCQFPRGHALKQWLYHKISRCDVACKHALTMPHRRSCCITHESSFAALCFVELLTCAHGSRHYSVCDNGCNHLATDPLDRTQLPAMLHFLWENVIMHHYMHTPAYGGACNWATK